MKLKILTIRFESIDDFMERSRKSVEQAIASRKKIIQKKDVFVWSSVEAYQQFMSDQKYSILAAIHKYRPQSVYKLAKILNRSQQNCARDCDLLEGHGFIKFIQSTEGRKAKVPTLSLDYNAIMICLPSVSYKVAFDDAA